MHISEWVKNAADRSLNAEFGAHKKQKPWSNTDIFAV
jgi:hypothetical protein